MKESNEASRPLLEVFGFPVTDFTDDAKRFWRNKLCPFNNRVPSCTKDKARAPLGVCSILSNNQPVITCPVRFRESWMVTEDAANFFFERNTLWTSITEVGLPDKTGKTAGNIDIVLVAYEKNGTVLDFGTIEIQGVYISGNIRKPFEHYMASPRVRQNMTWSQGANYPKPDYLSSSRKRLIPQVLYKGGILKTWGKKQAVVLQKRFFETLPKLPGVDAKEADIAWLLYELEKRDGSDRFRLVQREIVYTEFDAALDRIVRPEAGDMEDFMEILQEKLDEQMHDNPPDAPILTDTILQ